MRFITLPTLSGRWLIAYRLLWATAFAAAVAATLIAQLAAVAPAKLLHAAILIGVAVTLYRRRPADPVAAMLSLAFLLWAATTHASLSAMMGRNAVVALLDRLRFLLFVTALMLFPSGHCRPSWTCGAVGVTFVTFLIGVAAAIGLASDSLYRPLAMGCAALAVGALKQRFDALPPGVQRQQLKWVALGLGAGLVIVAASWLTGEFGSVPSAVRSLMFDFGVTVMALGILVSLLRYRLYDADAAISRSTAYAALTVTLVAVFAASEAVIQALSQTYLGGSAGAVSGAAAAAVAAAMIAPAHARVTDWTEQRFRKALIVLDKEAVDAADNVSGYDGVEEFAGDILQHIERAVRPTWSAMWVDGSISATRHVATDEVVAWRDRVPPVSPGISYDRDDPLFPCRIALEDRGGRALGWIVLGPRPDGSLYGREERGALAEIVKPVSRAVGLLRDNQSREEELAQLSHRLLALEQLVASGWEGLPSVRYRPKGGRRIS